MIKRFFLRIFAVILLSSFRFLMYALLSGYGTKKQMKKKENIAVENMQFLEEMMIKSKLLNTDITEGPEPVQSQAERKLIDAFLSHHNEQGEDDFYLNVALEWIEEKKKKSVRSSMFWACLLFVLLMFIIGLTIAYGFMGGVVAIFLLIPGFVCAVLGLFHAVRGKGCMNVVMLGVHLFLLMIYAYLLV